MNRIKMNEIIKTFGVFLVVAIVACGLVLPQQASAAPAAPNWLPGQPMLAGSQVIAMWLPVPGAVKYKVYLNGKMILESPANQYIGPAPDGSGEFKFQVSALDASGAESPMSKAGVIRIVTLDPPGAPIFRGNPNDESAIVRWDRVHGATIYNLYRSLSVDGPFDLATSTTELVFKDSGLELNKEYFYKVSVKDVSGKESAKGSAGSVKLELVEIAGSTQRAFELKIVSTKNIGVIRDFEDPDTGEFIPVSQTAALRRGPDGDLVLVLRNNTILIIDDNFELVRVVKPVSEVPLAAGFFDIAFDEDGLWYVTAAEAFIYVIDPDNGRVLNSIKARTPKQEEAPEVFEEMLPRHRGGVPWLGAITILQDGRILVFDAIGNLYHLLETDGTYSGWFMNYLEEREGKLEKRRLTNCKDLITLDDGKVVVTQMLGRKILALDPENDFVKVWQAGGFAGKVGNFVGMGGATMTPQGNLLVSDPTLGTVQAYSLENGDYLYSYSGPEGKPFANDPSRALVDFTNPNFPAYYDGGKKLVLFPAMQAFFLQREITSDYPPVKAAEK